MNICDDCQKQTSGQCWRHSTTVVQLGAAPLMSHDTCQAEIAALKSRLDEECRLNAMGQERELKLKSENAALKADRSAFAAETQQYRDAWLTDQDTIAKLKSELDRLNSYAVPGYEQVISEMRAELAAFQNSPTAEHMLKLERENAKLREAASTLISALKVAWGHQYESADMWELRALESVLKGEIEHKKRR